MGDLFSLKTYKKFGGKTAGELIGAAEVIESRSGDFYIRVGDADLAVNGDYDMCVSSGSTGICNMDLDQDEWRKLAALEARVDELYQGKLIS